jgi:hypothetical protein
MMAEYFSAILIMDEMGTPGKGDFAGDVGRVPSPNVTKI